MTSKPGRIHLQLPVAASDLGRLLIEARDADLVLEASGLSGQPLEVTPGRYYVSTTLPDGREVTADQIVEVGEDQDVPVELPTMAEWSSRAEPTADDDGTSIPVFKSRMVRLNYGRPTTASMLEPLAVAAARRWNGHWLQVWRAAGTDKGPDLSAGFGDQLRPDEAGSVRLDDRPGLDTLVADAAGTDGRCSFFVVPFDRPVDGGPAPTTTVKFARGSDGLTELVVGFPDRPATDAFLAYVQQGLAREARAISADLVAHGESAMADKFSSPLGAVLGGYVLLRANELEGMDLWTDQLYWRAPVLPDVLPLRVEYLARTGRHAEAINALGEVERFGCPWFRSGVSYLLERLRLYLAAHNEPDLSFQLGDERAARFLDLARTFGRLAVWLDPGRLVCTYRDVPVDWTAAPATPQQG